MDEIADSITEVYCASCSDGLRGFAIPFVSLSSSADVETSGEFLYFFANSRALPKVSLPICL